MAIVSAAEVFSQAAGFSAEEIARILAAGAGRTVAFGRSQKAEVRRQKAEATERALVEFAKGKTGEEAAAAGGMSRRSLFHELKRIRDRGIEGSRDRVAEWRAKGLSWREVGRLFGVSHEKARQMAGEEEPKSEVRRQKAEVRSEDRTET